MPNAALFTPEPHIVDQLILERAPRLMTNAWTRDACIAFLRQPLRYAEARAMADRMATLSGAQIMDLVASELALEVEESGQRYLAARGPAILVANHPTGLADGIALWQSVGRRRRDMRFLVNGDALRVAPGLVDVMIPIELTPARRSRAASRAAFRHLEEAIERGQLLVVFPSGRLAYLSWRGLRERIWLPSVLSIARRHNLPIVPLHIAARNSPTFYALSMLASELRDVTLFRELLNKRGRRFRLSYGPALDAACLPADPKAAVDVLQHHVERLLPLAAAGRAWEPGGDWAGRETAPG
jgi:putative hemolysin